MFIFLFIILLCNIYSIVSQADVGNNQNIPESFDSREKWPTCVSKIYDQGSCGSCYAVSVATAFSMRYCIKKGLREIIEFSPQNLVNCLNGCEGEFPDVVWDYVKTNGITTDECLPYKGRRNSCTNKCDNGNQKYKKYYSGEVKFMEDENEIKKEIMTNGPVTSMMLLYNDYYNYRNGIYSHGTNDDSIGYHAIVIIGWGIENNVKYWIIRDSYGNSRGEGGYMKIKINDASGAGASAYCDIMNGEYIEEIIENIGDDNGDDNPSTNTQNESKKSSNTKGKSENTGKKGNNSVNIIVNICKLLFIFLYFL